MSFLDNLDNPALATYLQGRALKLAGNEKEGNRLIDIAHWLPLGNEEVRAKLMEELGKRDWPEMVRKEAYMVLKTGWYKNYTIGNVLSQLARESAKEKHFFKAASYYEHVSGRLSPHRGDFRGTDGLPHRAGIGAASIGLGVCWVKGNRRRKRCKRATTWKSCPAMSRSPSSSCRNWKNRAKRRKRTPSITR